MTQRQSASQAAKAAPKPEMPRAKVETPTAPSPAAASPDTPEPVPAAASLAGESTGPAEDVKTNSKPQNAASSGRPAKEPLRDPAAREALAWVGADPEAEAYWCAAINNPELSAKERQDLIEDLNEDGLSDPKHPGPDDLPLIVNRILLIEELSSSALDQVNADAFAEAYKDLLNLASLAMGDGRPVR
jgi:hypothetical protein